MKLPQKLRVSCRGQLKENVYEAVWREIPLEYRRKTALRVGGKLFAFGVASILIPLLHFVLPIVFFWMAFHYGRQAYRTDKVLRAQEFACPLCSQAIEQELPFYAFPLSATCKSCARDLIIQPATQS